MSKLKDKLNLQIDWFVFSNLVMSIIQSVLVLSATIGCALVSCSFIDRFSLDSQSVLIAVYVWECGWVCVWVSVFMSSSSLTPLATKLPGWCCCCFASSATASVCPLPSAPFSPPASTLRLSLCTAIIWFLISVQFFAPFIAHSYQTKSKGGKWGRDRESGVKGLKGGGRDEKSN